MIRLMDEITTDAKYLPKILSLLEKQYIPSVSELGVTVAEQWVSPPVVIEGKTNTLWITWNFPDDLWGFWGFRGHQNDHMLSFWSYVDSVCNDRKRHALSESVTDLVEPIYGHDEYSQFVVDKETDKIQCCWSAQVFLAEQADERSVEKALTKLSNIRWSKNLEGSMGAGAYTLDLSQDCLDEDIAGVVESIPGIETVDQVGYRRLVTGVKERGLQDGIWRTLMLRINPEAQEADIAAWLEANSAMPAYMDGIRNWCLGEVITDSFWTHIWQQEFRNVEDLLGEYMLNDYHWGFVDHWFDAEFPDCVVNAKLSHAFGAFSTSLLS